MNPIQLFIIASVAAIILLTIGYYLLQEIKFKKMVENNFNQATGDVIDESESQAVVLDGVDGSKVQAKQKKASVSQKDIHVQGNEEIKFDLEEPSASINHGSDKAITGIAKPELFSTETEHPVDSVEAFFANIYKVPFKFKKDIDPKLDFIVDIGFEEITKIKALPEISQFTNKPFKFYVLDKNDEWQEFTKGNKYNAYALKLVIPLIDKDGVINQAQIANIYNELHKFVLQNSAHICKSDYESCITSIQEQVKHLTNVELNLVLYIITKDYLTYNNFSSAFQHFGLTDSSGTLVFRNKDEIVFTVTDENGFALALGNSYNIIQISSSLHKQSDPLRALDSIFDILEKFMGQYESRLLTMNKQLLAERDYEALLKYVNQHITNMQRHGIEPGSNLIKRLF